MATPNTDYGPTKVLPVTIASGASLSDIIDLGAHKLCAILMPAAWTAANLTFQAAISPRGTFTDVYDDAGVEVAVTAATSRCIGLDATASELAALRFIKLRSGTAGVPVNQGAARTIYLILKG